MWKIILAFIVFAALALFVIIKGGNKLDMGGEKHGEDAIHAPETPAANTATPTTSAPATANSTIAPASIAK
jgi:hypothetical protein